MLEMVNMFAVSPAMKESPGLAGKARILVMDDEKPVRDMMRRMLEMASFEVVAVPEGGRAIEAYLQAKESGQPFHLVLLDLLVDGGMNGLETMELLRKVDPEVKAIVCSGTLGATAKTFPLHGFCGAIEKPFTITELHRSVARAIAT
jgi:two-component system cell cycle sensor histidine kinase/response regulator CckA